MTLDRMAAGGIHDQIGGGFHRYSTDAYWIVPHFEKMLYDNALLARLYTHACLVTGAQSYARVARGIIDYVLREMTSDTGGFYSAQDADSEGVEGKFFVWRPEEVTRVLGRPDAEVIADYYGVNATRATSRDRRSSPYRTSLPSSPHATQCPSTICACW